MALPTAFANDVSAELCFAQQVLGLGRSGDILWAISTSGNSANILHAMHVAKAFGLTIIGLTGRAGGKMMDLCDVALRVPADSTPEIQELHLPIYHAICAELEERLFKEETKMPIAAASISSFLQFSVLDKIKLIVFDFDGVFTDNTVYVGQDGSECVRCSREDSLGLAMLQKKGGPECLILSTETSPVVEARAKKLKISCHQGCENKRAALESLMREKCLGDDEVAYMGNDLNDLEAMSIVGCSLAPSDAHPQIKKSATLVLSARGGKGAVRELCDMFLSKQ